MDLYDSIVYYKCHEWIDCLQALRYVVLYLILAPYDNEQSDLIHRVKEDKNLEEIPVYK